MTAEPATTATEPVEKPAPRRRARKSPELVPVGEVFDSGDSKRPEPLVSIKTVVEHDTIAIDDDVYPLKALADFGIVDQQALSRDGREFHELWRQAAELNANQRGRLKMLLGRIFAKITELPQEVEGKLNDESRAVIVLAFTNAPLLKAAREAAAEQTDTAVQTQESSTTAS